ncbi:MAG: hypothetical protein KF878_23720, partial [Planctomycetes bacterium]|nr:hypothetical protein [Planctomycetota bacterium]
REPDGLVDPACADWLLARGERLLTADPVASARAVALAARADVRRAPPAEFESSLRNSAGSRYVTGAPEAWLDLALAGLAAGANHGLFPAGVDLHFRGGLRGALERRLQERADDWPAALYLSLALLRTNREPDDLERGAALARRVLEAPDLTPHGRAFALEALGKHLLWSRSSAEAVACFEAALAAWHPRPDEVCLEASRCELDLGRPAAAVPWAERAVDLRDRRARGGPPEEGRPPGMPLSSIEGTRGAESFRLQARTTLLDRLLRAREHVRAEQVILDLGEQPWPGVVHARLGAVALAAVRGLRHEAHERARALSADPEVEARLLRNEGGWVRTLVSEATGDRAFARALARDLGVD